MGRTPCCSKEQGLNKGAWTAMEDKILIDYIKTYGQGRWRNIPKKAGLNRCGKSCRLRWLNYLRPDIKRGNISEDEEELIVRLHKLLGNRWALIAGRLPGRTDNEIKNYWNTIIGKKITNQQLISAPPAATTPYPVMISTHNEPHDQSKPNVPTIKLSSSSPAELQSLPDPRGITDPEDLKFYQNSIATLGTEVTSTEEPISPTSITKEKNCTNFPTLDNFMMDFDIDQDFVSDILNNVELSQLVATDHHHHHQAMVPMFLDEPCNYKSVTSFVGTNQSDWLHQDK